MNPQPGNEVQTLSLGEEMNEELIAAEANTINNDRGFGIYNGEMLRKPSQVIGKEEIKKAFEILQKYKDGKELLNARIVDEEDFYMLQYYKRAKKKDTDQETPMSGWTFNAIHTKHADMMDNYPEAICLPREQSDEEEAKTLTSILPVIMERNQFEQAYSDASWYKLKHGVSCYSVLWDSTAENGLGDIVVGTPDILNLYWAPGVTNIQNSPHFFSVDVVDNDLLEKEFPQLEGTLGGTTFDYKQYAHSTVDLSEKTLVIDWYYKKKSGGREVLHYCKFIENEVLYASENDSKYARDGYYAHGKYPFVFDVLFPEAGTPVGFGIIAIIRDPQVIVDIHNKNILEAAKKSSKVRYMAREGAGIDEKEWNDWDKPIVHVQGASIPEEAFKQIEPPNLPAYVINERDAKIDEIKQTSANLDFSQGTTTAGVTSGAAIATLQEAGNKTTRDMIKASYRKFVELSRLEIELIRQFYTEERTFRIKAPNGIGYEFVAYQNSGLQPQMQTMNVNGMEVPMTDEMGAQMVRIPIIDIDVKAQKQSPFTTMAQNETAMNLYNAGFFEPERAQQSMVALEMMDFEGKEKVTEYVLEGQTLLNQVQMLSQQLVEANELISQLTGIVPVGGTPTPNGGNPNLQQGNAKGIMPDPAQPVQTPYMDTLRQKARPQI